MPVRSVKLGSRQVHVHELSDPPLMDLTSPSWKLKDGEASFVLGMDVVFPNRFRPDRGRKPLGVFLDEDDRPVTSVIPLESKTSTTTRQGGVNFPLSLKSVHLTASTTYDPATGIINNTASAFTDYEHRLDDRILIHTPDFMRDAFTIVEKIDASNIRIATNLGTPTPPASTIPITEAFIVQGHNYVQAEDVDSGVDYIVKGHKLYERDGPWLEAIGRIIFVNEDERSGSRSQAVVTGLGTYAQPNDALLVDANAMPSMTSEHKFTVTTIAEFDRRGFIISNGRKFWLVSDGSLTLLMDLGDDTYKGLEWKGSRIANNRVLLTNPARVPRVLHLDRFNTDGSENRSLAGLVPPRAIDQRSFEDRQGILKTDPPSWLCSAVTSQGDLTAGTELQILVRGINLIDAVASDFVLVGTDQSSSPHVPTTGSTLVKQTVAEDDAFSVYPSILQDNTVNDPDIFGPLFHERMTHIEVWRTGADGLTPFFLESRIEIVDPDLLERHAWGATAVRLLADPTLSSNAYPVTRSDVDIESLPVLTNAEREASGGLPPACQDSVSLLGVTFCFGKADGDFVKPTVYARSFYSEDIDYTASTGRLTFKQGPGPVSFLANYNFREGDQFVSVFGGAKDGSFLPEGVYDIVSKVDGDTLEIAKNLTGDINPAGDESDIVGYIRRPHTWPWPGIETDEQVWYSRTDQFAPENFPPRIMTLSNIGDTFRRAVTLEENVLVVMDQGVHLLYLVDAVLLKNTLIEKGGGTPWPKSVVIAENRAVWATSTGIRVAEAFPDKDDNGRRGKIGFLDDSRTSDWFREAFDLGYEIDAGYDPTNRCIRFRRKEAEHVYQVLQISLRTGRWTLLDDDNGIGYAPTRKADIVEASSSLLYSVDPLTGGVFEVNDDTLTHPYDGLTLQGVLDESYSVSATSIRHLDRDVFASVMTGDSIRFRHKAGESVRTVLSASSREITFNSNTLLLPDDTFVIGASRFRVRFAPWMGSSRVRVKTLQGLVMRVRDGERAADSKTLVLRGYRDFESPVIDTDSLPVFNDSDEGRVSEDRHSSLTIQGSGLELEIENLDARNDFDIETVEALVSEELDPRSDTTET